MDLRLLEKSFVFESRQGDQREERQALKIPAWPFSKKEEAHQISSKFPCRPLPEANRAAPAAPSALNAGIPSYHSLRIASRSVSPSCLYTERRSARMQAWGKRAIS